MTPTRKIDGIDATPDTRRELLAAYAHDAWAGWMRYLFSKSLHDSDGTVLIPAWAVERWTRQVQTAYADLPDNEKASDRAEADKMLAITDPLSWESMWLRAAQSVTRLYWQNESWRRLYLQATQQRNDAEAERDELRQKLDAYERADHLRGLMSHDEYHAAMAKLEAIMDADEPATPEHLALFARVEEYEDYHFPTVEPTPEQAAAFRIEQRGALT